MLPEVDEPTGCVNRAFEEVDDGFQTIDLRTTIRRNRHFEVRILLYLRWFHI